MDSESLKDTLKSAIVKLQSKPPTELDFEILKTLVGSGLFDEAIKTKKGWLTDILFNTSYYNRKLSAYTNQLIEVFELFLDHGADINQHGEGYTVDNVLSNAIWGNCDVKFVKFLIDNGIDYHYLDNTKYESPADYAYTKKNWPVFNYLLDKGVVSNSGNNEKVKL